jgi:F1F0 ATPase subunit 2
MTHLSNALHALLALAAGFGLGLAFFGGLWWTVQRLGRGSRALWLAPLSSLTRTALLLAACWWVASGDPGRFALCLAGWLIARQIMIRRCTPATGNGGGACT